MIISKGEDFCRVSRIVAFTKDWSDVPTCTTHVLREMAKALPVLWIESIGTRKPSLAAGKDVRRIGRRLKGALAGAIVEVLSLRLDRNAIAQASCASLTWSASAERALGIMAGGGAASHE
jgi:hypothetical protein